MNTAVALLPLVEADPSILLTDPAKLPAWVAEKRAEVAAVSYDLSTQKGRDALKAVAFKVTKTKTAADAAGKKMNEAARAKINLVDEMRRAVRDTLDPLADEIKKPVTDWEAAEKARQTARDAILTAINNAVPSFDATPADIEAMIAEIEALDITEALFGSQHNEAADRRGAALSSLREARARAKQYEANCAEIERLRLEAEQRELRDRMAAEAKRQAEEEAERAAQEEARKARAAEDQKAREEAAAKAAAAKAQAEAERRAQEERAQQEAAHKAELARLQKIADDEAKARKAEADRIAAEKAEAERRAADREHRGKVMAEAKAAIMEHGGVEEDAAKKIVLAIVGGSVPHMSVRF